MRLNETWLLLYNGREWMQLLFSVKIVSFEGRMGNRPGSSPGDRTMPSGDTASEMLVTTRFSISD